MKKITFLLLCLIGAYATNAQVTVNENFDAGVPSGWSGTYATTTEETCENGSLRDNIYASNTSGNLTTLNYAGASNATDLVVSFDYKIIEFFSDFGGVANDPTPAGWGTAELQYSLDDGASWTTALTIDDSNHTVANTCATVMTTILAADLPTGSDVKLQILNTFAQGDYFFYLDNFEANQAVTNAPNCDAVVEDISVDGDVTWTAATGGPDGYFVTVGSTPGGNDLADNVDVGDALTTNVGILTVGSTYYVTIVPYNAIGPATGCTEQTATVPCLDPTAAGTGNITATSADLDWTENNGATTWNIEWGPDGFTQGMGNLISGVTTNPYTLMGLMDGTPYDYYVQTDCGTSTSMWVGPISFTTTALPPANDDFANAQALMCGDNILGNTSAATLDEDDAPDGFGADLDAPNVWFTYTGSGTVEDVTIDLCPSTYDTSFLVYTGTSGDLTLVGGNDDNASECGSQGGNTRSFGTFTSDGTTTYYITVEGWNSTSTGAFDLTITCESAIPAPGNDECGAADPLTLGTTVSGTTVGATQNGAEEQPTCDLFGAIADVWYTATVPASGLVTITTAISGTSDQANVAVYTACGGLQADQIACSEDNGGESVELTGQTEGEILYIRVWSDGVAAARNAQRAEGTFDITATDASLSANDFDSETGFTYYPNPVKNTLTLNAQQNIDTVTMYNMLGQEVLRLSPNAVNAEVDMSNLNTGAYFATVSILGNTQTVRIIKQ